MPGVITDRRQGITAAAAVKVPCKTATTANITLYGEQTIDGVACTAGNRVLVKNQTNPVENGIYIVNTSAWQRSPDFDGSLDVRQGTFVYVTQGSTNTGFWYVTTANPIIPGTTSIMIERASSILAAVSTYAQTLLDDADAATARNTLGAQAADATLQSLSSLGTAADRIAYTTGVDTWAETPLTAFIRTLLDDADAAAAQATLSVPSRTNLQTWIDGLKLEWVSGSALTIKTGSAYIPSLGRIYDVASDIELTGLSFTANTWYHVYLYDNAGSPAAELSTTAPAAPYAGTARTKTGDTSRRYIGSVRSNNDATPIMYNFLHAGYFIKYRNDQGVSPFRVLSEGVATTETTVSLSAVVPVTSRLASVRFANTSDALVRSGTSDDSASGPPNAAINHIIELDEKNIDHPLNSSQELTYWLSNTPTSGGLTIDIHGYLLER